MLLSGDTFDRLCRARDLLRVSDETPSIRDVADASAVSPYHFIRLFHAVFGATPHQYRIHARLEHARHLLALGNLSVTDICLEVGFSSLGTFSDLFARRVGVPPSAYRRRARTLVQVPGSYAPAVMPGCLGLMALLPASAFAISKKRGAAPPA